jgi:hypothetical protein
MNNEEKYNILRRALTLYYDIKIKNLPREEIDLFKARELYDRYYEIDQWLLEWYEELEPYDVSPKSKKVEK